MALEGQVTVITGAASGLGAATARRFAAHGAKVVLGDVSEEAGTALADDLGALFVRTDVTDEAQVAALVDAAMNRFGRLDCMINNAGRLGVVGGIAEIEAADWSATLAVLLDSVFFGMKHASRVMADGGAILSTTSVGGVAALAPHAYTTAKHAVVGLTRSVASELAGRRIRVNCVAPGQVPTGLTIGAYGDADALRQFAAARNPLGTVIEPDEIAGAFAYLAGPDGRNITGQVLVVDSGLIECRLGADYYGRDTAYVGG